MNRIKLFIVDDHYMVVEGIRMLLNQESDIEFTGSASNAASCLAFLRLQQPDVILMDINLPDMDGTELCKQVKTLYPSVFVLGLSTFNQQSFIQKMMDHGASGYLLKNAGQEELTEAIHTVVKGKTYINFDVAAVLRKKDDNTLPLLTRREKEVLHLIAEGGTNTEIAEKLFVSPATVDTHRKNLLTKLQAKNTASLVKIAMQHHLI